VPSADRSAEDGIAYLKLCERQAAWQLSAEYPNGYAIPDRLGAADAVA
jgi:hypothetical protein